MSSKVVGEEGQYIVNHGFRSAVWCRLSGVPKKRKKEKAIVDPFLGVTKKTTWVIYPSEFLNVLCQEHYKNVASYQVTISQRRETRRRSCQIRQENTKVFRLTRLLSRTPHPSSSIVSHYKAIPSFPTLILVHRRWKYVENENNLSTSGCIRVVQSITSYKLLLPWQLP